MPAARVWLSNDLYSIACLSAYVSAAFAVVMAAAAARKLQKDIEVVLKKGLASEIRYDSMRVDGSFLWGDLFFFLLWHEYQMAVIMI